MKKTKTQKGITLIALIITIVVLLILAVVAISSITNDGILQYAQNASTSYNQAATNEQGILEGYINYLDKNSSSTTYTSYTIGQTVTIGSETFYVIADSDETQEMVTLLAKKWLDTATLVQHTDGGYGATFSETAYWSTIEGITYPYDLTETGEPDTSHYAAYYAYQYGTNLGGTGRLMTYSEAIALESLECDFLFDYENGGTYYWLGTACDEEFVYMVNALDTSINAYKYSDEHYVRPVVEISKTKLS